MFLLFVYGLFFGEMSECRKTYLLVRLLNKIKRKTLVKKGTKG